MGFQTYIFCSKVPSKCRKCRFRDRNFKKCPGGACPRTPLQLCRHYGLPLTKILATPLTMTQHRLNYISVCHVHRERLDKVDVRQLAKEFVGQSEIRRMIFGCSQKSILIVSHAWTKSTSLSYYWVIESVLLCLFSNIEWHCSISH